MFSVRHILTAGAAMSAIALASTFLISTHPVNACLHPPHNFQYPIKSGAQRGLVYYADGYETMVLRPSYKVEGKGLKVKNDAVEGFTTLAWIVPVPNLPNSYKEADNKLFKKLAGFTKPYQTIAADSPNEENSHGARKAGAEFMEQVKVGDYTIQPIKAHGEIGGTEMTGWMKDNGFGEIDNKVLKYYLDNDYYWLAVKLHRDEGLPASGEVKPLAIGFKADAPTYPIKINQGHGSFDLELWLITRKKVDTWKCFGSYGFTTVETEDGMMAQEHRTTQYKVLPEEVRKLIDDQAGLKTMKEGDLYCYRFFGKGLDKDIDLSKLTKDLTFAWAAEKKKDASKDSAKKPQPKKD